MLVIIFEHCNSEVLVMTLYTVILECLNDLVHCNSEVFVIILYTVILKFFVMILYVHCYSGVFVMIFEHCNSEVLVTTSYTIIWSVCYYLCTL